jgi:hypothetical protein
MGDRGGEEIAAERRDWYIYSGGATESEFGWSHPQARVEPHSHGQSGALIPFQACIQPLHGVEHPQPRPHQSAGRHARPRAGSQGLAVQIPPGGAACPERRRAAASNSPSILPQRGTGTGRNRLQWAQGLWAARSREAIADSHVCRLPLLPSISNTINRLPRPRDRCAGRAEYRSRASTLPAPAGAISQHLS